MKLSWRDWRVRHCYLTSNAICALADRPTASSPAYFNWLSPTMVDAFLKKCRSMYQNGQEGSPSDKLLVYSMMANTCSELSGTDEGELASYNYSLSRSFSNLMLETLATFPMLAPACLDTAEALMVAVGPLTLHCIDCKSGKS